MAPITIIPKACSCCKGERSSRDKSSNLPLPNILYEGSEGRLTGLRPEGCGRLSAAGYVRFAQGATAPAALKVADCRSAVHSEHILKER